MLSAGRRYWIATLLLTIEVLIIWCTSYLVITYAPDFSWLIGLSTLPLFGVVYFMRPRAERRELELHLARKLHVLDKEAFAEEQRVFEAIRKQALDDMKIREAQMLQRQRELERRTKLVYEWAEFPTPTNDLRAPPSVDKELEVNARLRALIQEEAKQCFVRFQEGEYTTKDKTNRRMLHQDLLDLIEQVARIYQPTSERPLLETTPHQLLRALNRIALQLLVSLDQLPIDIKNYNIKDTYAYLQRGAKAYGLYKSASDYWSYMQPGYYLGRIALGAHPLTLVVGWISGEIVKVGTKNISQKVSNHYAFGIIHQLVEIVVIQSASVFDPNYRYRDPAWYYGVELTELMYRFPHKAHTWPAALKELGALQLPSEYDRIFLYRCLSEQKSAIASTLPASTQLAASEQAMIYHRIQRFAQKYVHTPGLQGLDVWQEGVAGRLGQSTPPAATTRRKKQRPLSPAKANAAQLTPALREHVEALVGDNEALEALYPKVKTFTTSEKKPALVIPKKNKLAVVVTTTRFILIQFHTKTHHVNLLWTSETARQAADDASSRHRETKSHHSGSVYEATRVQVHEQTRRWEPTGCILTGGNWLDPNHGHITIHISGVRKYAFDVYFAPLINIAAANGM